MAEITKPDYSNLWASGGAVIAPSVAKIQVGWTAEIPPHQWENWTQNRQDTAIAYLFQRGIAEWDATTEYWAGKSAVMYGGAIYIAATNNTNSEPSPSNPDWKNILVPATAAQAGVIELATQAEVNAGVDTTRAVTPATLANTLGRRLGHTYGLNDWRFVDSNLIEQWGIVSCTAHASNNQETGTLVTLPRTGVAAVLNIQATPTFSYEELGCLSAYGSTVNSNQIRIVMDWSQGTGGATKTQDVFWKALCRI